MQVSKKYAGFKKINVCIQIIIFIQYKLFSLYWFYIFYFKISKYFKSKIYYVKINREQLFLEDLI